MRANFKIEEYEAGHMMYLHGASLAKLKVDASAFFKATLAK
jgi:carboxypeptidase C (cathepsin A)